MIYVRNKYIQWFVRHIFLLLSMGLFIAGVMIAQTESYTSGLAGLLTCAASAGALYGEYKIHMMMKELEELYNGIRTRHDKS